MKLDRLIRKLLPKDDKFYRLFSESTENLLEAAAALKRLAVCTDQEMRATIIADIREMEHKGDHTTHKIFSALNGTFVTPLDREDIHILASSLDDVMDHIDGSVARVSLYKLDRLPPPMVQLTEVLHNSVAELHRGVGLLRDLHQFEELQEVFERVNEYENVADDIFEQALADLFEHEKDPIHLIKLKEVYVGLETATDKCEDVANVLEAIMIKHA